MHVSTDSKVALAGCRHPTSKRLSSWELLDLAKRNRTLKPELARQGTEPKKQQPPESGQRCRFDRASPHSDKLFRHKALRSEW
jgi:hypothetical protein